jgi:hypothetical protein
MTHPDDELIYDAEAREAAEALGADFTDLIAEPPLCVICKDAPATSDDYCAPCQALVDELDADVAMNCQEFEAALQVAVAARRAFPILRPITVKPVELNAQLWAEVRRETEKLP